MIELKETKESTVEIEIEDYRRYVQIQERVDAVRRLADRDEFINVERILTVLGL